MAMKEIEPIEGFGDPEILESINHFRERIREALGFVKGEHTRGAIMTEVRPLEQQLKEAEAEKAPPVTLPLRATKVKEVYGAVVYTHWESSESDAEITPSQVTKLMEAEQTGAGSTVGSFKCRQIYNEKYKATWTTQRNRAE